MHPRRILVVTVVALLAIVSASTNAKVTTFDSLSKPENSNGVGTKRLLRPSDQDGERAFFFPGFATISKTVNSMKANVKLKQNLRARLKAGESADDVSKMLIPETNVKRVLSNPNFDKLAKYVSEFNERYPDKKVRLIDVLTKRYGEAAVSKMLVSARNVASTREWALKLQGNQVAGWLNTKQPLDVFRALQLGDAATLPLTTRNLKAWQNYMEILTKRQPEKAMTMFQAFRKVYKDAGLARLLDSSRYDEGVGPVALELKSSLFQRWRLGDVTMGNIDSRVFHDKLDNAAKRIKTQYETYLGSGRIALW